MLWWSPTNVCHTSSEATWSNKLWVVVTTPQWPYPLQGENNNNNDEKWLLEATNLCYIRTWNVCTLCGNGNKEILLHQLRGYKWHVTGLAETHITGKGEYDIREGIKLIYSGKEEEGEAQHGVSFLLKRKAPEALIASHPTSAQIISIWLSCQGMKATFIQVYAPTADSSDHEINSFCNDLQITLNSIPKKYYVIILGDFNAKIGVYQPLWKDTMGKFGIGNINECGERLLQFCIINELFVANTASPHKSSRKWTWNHPNRVHNRQCDWLHNC